MQTAHYPPAVLTKAFTWAYEELGLSAAEAAQILGINEGALHQTALLGFPDDTPQTQTQLAFIRCYYQLITSFSGNTDRMRCWFHHANEVLAPSPKALCSSQQGITRVTEYLIQRDEAALQDGAVACNEHIHHKNAG